MKVWLVIRSSRWDQRHTIVRAETRGDAVNTTHERDGECEVIELPHEGDKAILWAHEESVDSNDFD